MSILYSFLHRDISNADVFRSWSCSQAIRQRIRRHLGFQLSIECPNPSRLTSQIVQLVLLSQLRGTLLLSHSVLSSSEVDNEISPCASQCVQQAQSYSFLRVDRQRNRCARRLWICQHVLGFRTVLLLLVSRQDTALHASMEQNQVLVVHSFVWLNVARSNCLGPNTTISCMPMCIVLHLPYFRIGLFSPIQHNLVLQFLVM